MISDLRPTIAKLGLKSPGEPQQIPDNRSQRFQSISWESWLQSMIFALVLFGLGATNLFGLRSATESVASLEEGRNLASLPGLGVLKSEPSAFAGQFENFFNDHFSGRLLLTRLRSLAFLKIFHSSTSNAVVLGKNGWLFFGVEPLMVYDPFTDDQLKLWTQLLQNRSDMLAEKNIKFVFVVVPEKSSIYPEQLPKGLRYRPGSKRFNQLADYLPAHSNVCFIDLRQPFMDAKANGTQVYLKQDSHWSERGALVAANEIFRRLHHSFPNVAPLDSAMVHFSLRSQSGDLCKMLGLKNVLWERAPQWSGPFHFHEPIGKHSDWQTTEQRSTVETVSTNAGLPRAFILRDSFTLALQPFLSERFSDAQYYWYQAMPFRRVLAAQPQVVIQEMAERHLYTLGYMDDFQFGGFPYYQVRQSSLPPGTMSGGNSESRQVRLAASGYPVGLESLQSDVKGGSIKLKLTWQSSSDCIPNAVVNIHALDAKGQAIETVAYPQNPSYLSYEPGDRWRDDLVMSLGDRISKVERLSVSFAGKEAQYEQPIDSGQPKQPGDPGDNRRN